MFNKIGIEKYIILIGDPEIENGYCYDEYTNTLTIKCSDTYEGLPEKIIIMCKVVKDLFKPEYIVKIDDDVILYDISYIKNVQYGGLILSTKPDTQHTWHVGKCSSIIYDNPFVMNEWTIMNELKEIENVSYADGSSSYVIGKKSIDILAKCPQNLYKSHMYEDMLVGYILLSHGISCESIMNHTRKRNVGLNLHNKKVMLKNQDITKHIILE